LTNISRNGILNTERKRNKGERKMYRVYTKRNDYLGFCITCVKKGLTKEEAIELKAKRMANPNRVCNYIIVAESRVDEFFQKLKSEEEILKKTQTHIWAIKEKRWEKADEMYLKGRRVRDMIGYLNG
jgi:hypothetical protein